LNIQDWIWIAKYDSPLICVAPQGNLSRWRTALYGSGQARSHRGGH